MALKVMSRWNDIQSANGKCTQRMLIADRESLGASIAVERSLQTCNLSQTRKFSRYTATVIIWFFDVYNKGPWYPVCIDPIYIYSICLDCIYIYTQIGASWLLTSSLATWLGNFSMIAQQFFTVALDRSKNWIAFSAVKIAIKSWGL